MQDQRQAQLEVGRDLLGADEAALRERLGRESGRPVTMAFGAFDDLENHVRRQVEHLRSNPWLKKVPVHGLIFDVSSGRLHEVD